MPWIATWKHRFLTEMGESHGLFFGLATVFAVSGVLTLGALTLGPGCQTRCFQTSECGAGSFCSPAGRCETECFTNLDCRQPPECQNNPTACTPRGLNCNPFGRCVGTYSVARPNMNRMTPDDERNIGGPAKGWDLPPAAGRAYIVSSIAIAPKDRGFDLNGDGKITNSLYQLGELGNDQIRQGLLGGESLLLIELAGLDNDYRGNQDSLTVKIYGARDADDPPFPANNFKIPPGHTSCCEFKINPNALMSGGQARARAPAKIVAGHLLSLQPVPIQFTLTVGVPPHPEIKLERVLMSARIPSNIVLDSTPGRGEIEEGLLGGAVPVNTLALTENPYCKTVSPRCTVQFTDSTLIDLVATLLSPRPDIDLDEPPDGLETVIVNGVDGRVFKCCEGNGPSPASLGNSCLKREIPPTDPAAPWTCALNPKMRDGYSVGISFIAVRARIVGFGQ